MGKIYNGAMTLKVVLIYRKPRQGAYSIEEVFHTLAGELKKQTEVIEYEVGGYFSILLDVWKLQRLKADIYHVTGDVNYFINFLPNKKTVLTIHDIGHYLFGLKGVKRWLYKWVWLIFPIRSANKIISISPKTKKDIIQHLRISDKNIGIIEDCHSAIFKPVKKSFVHKSPLTILQVGTAPYKNVPRLIEALKGLNCCLVLIGAIDENTRQKLIDYQINYENYIGLSHEELYQKYIESDIVTFVSLGEGFGVPIIEAQAVGRPIITANISPMCDVAGKGACLVDPLDEVMIRKGIQHIISDRVYRDRIIEDGFLNVEKFSPETISRQYFSLYKSMILA